jgi:hypothetical protein
MNSSVQQCMARPNLEIEAAAKKAGISYITLSTKEGKLSVCQQLSNHQQDLFLPSGINPLVSKTLEKQEKQCNMCKA